MTYATTAQLRDFVRITDNVDDEFLDFALESASRIIDLHCNRSFSSATTTRTYDAATVIDLDDLVSVTLVEVDGEATDGYTLYPRNYTPKTQIRFDSRPTGDVEITGTWGWASVPDPIVHACLLQASRFVARRDSPFGIAGSPELGNEIRLQSRVDPDVAVVLRPYIRWAA